MPEVLENVLDLDIEYIGPIPRALKNEDAQALSQWISEVVGISQQAPESQAQDIVDWDEALRGLGQSRGVPAMYMNDDATIKKIRTDRAKKMEEMRQMQMLEQASKAGKNLGIDKEQPQETVQ